VNSERISSGLAVPLWISKASQPLWMLTLWAVVWTVVWAVCYAIASALKAAIQIAGG
jgi:hypothetical protein